MNSKDKILDTYDHAYRAASASLPGSDADWLSGLRDGAMQAFKKSGFPTRKDEAWRYTDLAPLQKRTYKAAEAAAEPAQQELPPRKGVEGARIVLVNGKFSETLSDCRQLEPVVTFMSLTDALDQKPELVAEYLSVDTDGDSIQQLNTALMSDGCVIIAKTGARPAFPLEILYLSSGEEGAVANIRNLVVLEKGSRLSLIETCRGGGDFWNNIATGIFLCAGARLDHYQNQGNDDDALLSAATTVHISEDGRYRNFALTKGGRVARNEIRALLEGRDAEANLDGLCLARAGQSLAQVTIVEHLSAEADSNQRYKSILDGRASAAFQGKVIVAKDAQQSEAHQASDSLLLGEGATANAKPELLIHADDVKCSHGATVGALDEAALFYLNSRGLDPEAAKALLVAAFAEEILEGISCVPLRNVIRDEVARWMQDRGAWDK